MSQTKKVVPIRTARESESGGAKGCWTPEARLERIRSLIESILKTFDSEKPKATVGDLIRLMQIEDDLLESQPKDVTVQWIEPKQG
ncbi:MAG: hypothetical protein LC114_27425 [Bryobacterales bacterium]|nr:hypothetical protein [Bryobacterales bacterium]